MSYNETTKATTLIIIIAMLVILAYTTAAEQVQAKEEMFRYEMVHRFYLYSSLLILYPSC